MIIQQLSRYPIKGLNGEPLNSARLDIGAGIVGDRRFAFGIDGSVDDGVWRSSRSYLINAVNDNLLKFRLVPEENGWRLQNPQGEVVQFSSDISTHLQDINTSLENFMSAVTTNPVPRLIDRRGSHGPLGHWDFPDSELLIVNLATVKELETRWGIEIDPKRFRYNVLIDGTPAWSEFGLYGSPFSIGDAQVDILRPARRCAALEVNPISGDRDEEIVQCLVRDYGHGFLGVYAKVSKAGTIAVGQSVELLRQDAISSRDAVCDIAPGIAHWPKAAEITREGENLFRLSPISSWPLIDGATEGNMKIHHGHGSPIVGEILSVSQADTSVLIHVEQAGAQSPIEQVEPFQPVLISGPYSPRRKR